jgi:membrane-bound metal-dependent hydrolase YbcI (DUF457 family)
MRLAANRLMEPLTHALASFTLGRAGLDRTTRLATPMLLVSGLAADLDWISYKAGPAAFLEWHRTASHSLLGTAVISVGVASGFWLAGRGKKSDSRPVRYLPALAVCAAGAGLHLLMDLSNSAGVKLLWPFNARWFAWDLAGAIDPVLLFILLAGVLVPGLLNLIGEEIGGRARRKPTGRGAIIALSLAVLYIGGRAIEHQRADSVLNSHTYRQEAPIRTGVLPTSSPLLWRGVVETETALYEIEVPLSPGARFDPRTAKNQLKPDSSQALRRAGASPAGSAFLAYARFPAVSVEPVDDGSVELEIWDLRDASGAPDATAVIAEITLNAREEITRSALQFETDTAR